MMTTSIPQATTCPAFPLNSSIEEGSLVARLRRGDSAAFESLVRTHGGRLLSVARRFLGSNEDAEDAVQETFIKAFKAIGTFEERAQLHTWLHRIVVTTSLMKLRERRRKPQESIDDLLPAFTADGHHASEPREWSDAVFERKETASIVRQAIDMLPDQHRAILVLRDIEERDTAETAAILGTTTTVVKVRLHRARQALRSLLNAQFKS
jgi:RNA polymerase sigma-70 factor, ECF subfamily